MVVVADGIIYHLQSKGGISRVFSEILPRMCDADDSLHIALVTQGPLRQALPQHQRITHCSIPDAERYLRPRRIWKPFIPAAGCLLRFPTDNMKISVGCSSLTVGWLRRCLRSLRPRIVRLAITGILLMAGRSWMLREGVGCSYFDIHKSDYESDYAAAARAVVCIKMVK